MGVNQSFQAKIISGRGRGRQLGYPTLNLAIQSGDKPKFGVYGVRLDGQEAVMHVGSRPTFQDNEFSIEVYVLDTTNPQVADSVLVEILIYLRDTVKFDSSEALKKQIEQDIMAARKYFASHV